MRLRLPLSVLGLLLVALAGCGDGAPPNREGSAPRGGAPANPERERPAEEVTLGAGGRPAPQKTRVATLGDSITAGSPLWDPDEATRASIGSSADPRSQYQHWVRRRMPDVSLTNCGVFGERTDEIADRLEGCARGADVLIVQGGINDVAQRRPVEEAARNLRGMVLRGKRLGLRVALAEVLPWNNGYPAAAAPIDRLNGLIARIGRDEEVPVLPWYERLEDPSSPGRMKAQWTIDGDHPSVAGYRRLADIVRLPRGL